MQQEAQLSLTDRALLRVIEYFAQGHSRSFEMTPLSVSPSVVTMSVSRTVSQNDIQGNRGDNPQLPPEITPYRKHRSGEPSAPYTYS